MLTKSIGIANVPGARSPNDVGLTLWTIMFVLLFAFALLSAFMHPGAGDAFETMAML